MFSVESLELTVGTIHTVVRHSFCTGVSSTCMLAVLMMRAESACCRGGALSRDSAVLACENPQHPWHLHAQAHQLLAKILAKSRRARGPVALAEILPAKPKAPRSRSSHRITESIAESTSSVCVCAKMGAAVCPNPYRATLVGTQRAFHAPRSPFHTLCMATTVLFPRSTLHAHTVGNKAVHQTSSRS